MKYALFYSIFFIVLVQCSDNTNLGKKNNSKQEHETRQDKHVSILNDTPKHIQLIENLTVFPGDSKPSHSIVLTPRQVFGLKNEHYLMNILGCVVDNFGRLIVWNTGSNYKPSILIFNKDGTYHSELGKTGKGPGEFGNIFGIGTKADKVFVLDYTSQRLNEYSTGGYVFEQSILFNNWKDIDGFRLVDVRARSDGNYLIMFSNYKSVIGRQEIKYALMDKEGNSLDFVPLILPAGYTIKTNESLRPTMPLTFLGQTITTQSEQDELYSVWTRDFLIKKYDANGNYQSAFYYPIQGSPFNLNEYSEQNFFSPNIRNIKKVFSDQGFEFPKTFPLVDRLIVDDENRIWVALPAGTNRENYEWWILKESGELLAKLLHPKDEPIYEIKNGYLYSKKMNEDAGTEYVIKYKIELKKRSSYTNLLNKREWL